MFFALLRWNTSLYLHGRSLAFAMALQGSRFSAVGGLFALIALHGALPLLLAAARVAACPSGRPALLMRRCCVIGLATRPQCGFFHSVRSPSPRRSWRHGALWCCSPAAVGSVTRRLSLHPVRPAGSARTAGGDDRRANPQYHERRTSTLPAADRHAVPLHLHRQLVIACAGRRTADRAPRDRCGASADCIPRDDVVRHPLAWDAWFHGDFCRTLRDHDPAQPDRDGDAHLLAGGPAVRQRDEWRVRHRHRAVAGRAACADPADGPRAADRRGAGLYLQRACHGLHRQRHQGAASNSRNGEAKP